MPKQNQTYKISVEYVVEIKANTREEAFGKAFKFIRKNYDDNLVSFLDDNLVSN